MLCVHSAPARNEGLPSTQLRLLLTENEFCLIVRSTLRLPSVMFVGRLAEEPPAKLNDG